MKEIFTRHTLCVSLALAFGLFVMTPLLYMAFDDSPCSEVTASWFEPSQARSGDVVMLHWTTKNDMACGGEITRRFTSTDEVKSFSYVFGTERVSPRTPSKVGHSFEKPMAIPNLVPGDYYYDPLALRWRGMVQWAKQRVMPSYETPATNLMVRMRVVPADNALNPNHSVDRLARQLP